jgi:hypothetical protein
MQLTSKKLPKKSNPIAREVRTPKYKQRIVKNKTIYSRKEEKEWAPTKGLLKMLKELKGV